MGKIQFWCVSLKFFFFLFVLQGAMTMAELSEQLNLTSIRDNGWHLQVFILINVQDLISVLSSFYAQIVLYSEIFAIVILC